MRLRRLIWCLSPSVIAACSAASGPEVTTNSGFITNLPEQVLTMVAPNQDLNRVRIDPADGCYVYEYAGPVETTYLPLRTVSGRPICTQLPDTTETG